MKIGQGLIESILHDHFEPTRMISQGNKSIEFERLVKSITEEIRKCEVIHNVMALHAETLIKLDKEVAAIERAKQGIENEKAHQVERCLHRDWLVVHRGDVETIECAICGKVQEDVE